MNSTEIYVLLSGIAVFVAIVIMILVSIKVYRKEKKKCIESIKPGDIFCFYSDVDAYYREFERYKHELTNPFDPTPLPLIFPGGTCIIKELKESNTGEIWVCFNLIGNPEELNIAENSDKLVKHYRTLNEFLELREKVERVEI